MEKLNIEIKPLFLINLGGNEKVVSQDSIDYYKKWWKDTSLEVIEELGEIDLGNIELFVKHTSSGRCYVAVTYELVSEKPLDSFGLEVLRASGNFSRGAGQANGRLERSEEVNGKFVYTLRSECDSSD